jgi:hypothetical protein
MDPAVKMNGLDYWRDYFQFEGIHTHNDDVRFRMRQGMAMCDALTAILADPHGCRFCDSGKLRNPKKEHDDTCGYLLAATALKSEK